MTRRFPVLWGLWFISSTRGRYAAAREAGLRLLAHAEKGADSGRLLEAHHALWPTLIGMGQSAAAVPHMERGIALYRKERHTSQVLLYAGHDPGVCCRYQMALARWLLGYPDAALAMLGDAYRLADELKHAHTMLVTLWFGTIAHTLRGERGAAAGMAERLLALAETRGSTQWNDVALVARQAARRPLDRPSLAEAQDRLLAVPITAWRRVFCLCFLVELCLEADCPEQGRAALAAIGEEDRSAFLAPEILRLDGELARRGPMPAPGIAEQSFRRAMDLARARTEKSLELRAATSLARLLAGRGQADAARELLADVYGSFTEGFETRDLREARALLARRDPGD